MPTEKLSVLQQGRVSIATLTDLLYTAAAALVLLLVVLAIARMVRARVLRAGRRVNRDAATVALLSNLAYLGTIALGAATVFNLLNVNVPALVTVLGVSGLAVSLALQDVLRNFVAGVYLLLEKPFTIGDEIQVRDVTGSVTGVELRTTRIVTALGAEVIVPNLVVMTEIVTNRTPAALVPYAAEVRVPRSGEAPDVAALIAVTSDIGGVDSGERVHGEILQMDAESIVYRVRFWAERGSGAPREASEAIERAVPGAAVTLKAES